MEENRDYHESELEKNIIQNLENFMMELGKGFAFVKRQQHIHTEKEDYYIDLVFYNYIMLLRSINYNMSHDAKE